MKMVKGRRGDYAGLGRIQNQEDWGRSAAMQRYNSGKELSNGPGAPKDASKPQFKQDRCDGYNDVANDWRRGNGLKPR
jgi:hypothetical protein